MGKGHENGLPGASLTPDSLCLIADVANPLPPVYGPAMIRRTLITLAILALGGLMSGSMAHADSGTGKQTAVRPAPDLVRLTEMHGWRESVTWRMTPEGIVTQGRKHPRKTWQAKWAVLKTWKRHGKLIASVAALEGVPAELLLAAVAIESRGNPRAVRREPGYVSDARTPHKAVLGLGQMLLSTARATMGNRRINRRWLFQPANAMTATARYMKRQARTTRWDPPLVAAAYNAGGVYHQTGEKNRWKMRNYPIGTATHINKFVYGFNASMRLFGKMKTPPATSFTVMLRNRPPTQTTERHPSSR